MPNTLPAFQSSTADILKSALNPDIYMKIDDSDPKRSTLYEKQDVFNFPIVNCPQNICSSIPSTHSTKFIYLSRWFSSGTPVSSTNKTEILLKVPVLYRRIFN